MGDPKSRTGYTEGWSHEVNTGGPSVERWVITRVDGKSKRKDRVLRGDSDNTLTSFF